MNVNLPALVRNSHQPAVADLYSRPAILGFSLAESILAHDFEIERAILPGAPDIAYGTGTATHAGFARVNLNGAVTIAPNFHGGPENFETLVAIVAKIIESKAFPDFDDFILHRVWIVYE